MSTILAIAGIGTAVVLYRGSQNVEVVSEYRPISGSEYVPLPGPSVAWDHPEPYQGPIDRVLSAFGFNWLYKKSESLTEMDKKISSAPGAVANWGGQQIGDALSAWLSEVFSSPTTLMVMASVGIGLILTILIIKKI